MKIIHHVLANGRMTSVVYNGRGIAVADLQNHKMSGEEFESMARQFERDNPELFGDQPLVDTADQSKEKNPAAYTDGMQIIPGH